MTENNPRLIQAPVRLSQSKLWQIQKNYFATMGIKAWNEEVPFYISSNAFVGFHYALLVVNFIKDWIKNHPNTTKSPFYIVELGSGTGKFSFHFLKEFKKLLLSNQLAQLPFCYIVTDVVESNLEFCQKNAHFQSSIENDEMDFACFDVENDKDLFLKNKQKQLSELINQTPVIFVGNYTFDCITQDAFECKKGVLEQVNVGLQSRYKNFDLEKARHLDDLRLSYDFNEISAENYYSNSILNEILKTYVHHFQQAERAHIMMPLGAFSFVDNMRNLTKDKFFFIMGDKGVAQLATMALLTAKQRVTYDGCYSFLVNFHAIGEYHKQSGGDALLTCKENDFKVNLYCAGMNFDELPETKNCYLNVLEKVGPDEYCYIYDEYMANGYRFSLPAILAFLRLSHWDPDAYMVIHERLLELLPTIYSVAMQDVIKALNHIKENIYPISFGGDAYNLLGIFYQSQGSLDIALELYQQSIKVFGEKTAPYYNAAMIYEQKKNSNKALEYYKKAYQLDKKNILAKKKIYKLSGRPILASLVPLLKGTLVFLFLAGAMYLISR